MLKTLNAILAIQTASTSNLLVYYLRKLPFLRKLITTTFYARHHLKRNLAIPIRIMITLGKFMASFTYVGLLLYLPVRLLGEELSANEQFSQFIHLFVLLSIVVACVSNAMAFETKRSKYTAVRLMRMSPDRYMKATLSYKYGMLLLCLLPAMLFFGILLGGSALQLLLLTLAALLLRVFAEFMHFKYFERTGKLLIRQNGIIWGMIGLGFTAAYLPLVLHQTPVTRLLLLDFYLVVPLMVPGLIATKRLASYPDYRTVVEAATKRDDPLLDLQRMATEANQSAIQSKDDDYEFDRTDAGENKFKSKKGYAYLNAIFLARHRSLIRRPFHLRLTIIAIAMLIGSIASLLFEPIAHFFTSNIGASVAFLALMMFYFTVGEKMCKAMFFHCDLSMMRYRFYRHAASHHFRIRLIQLLKQNLTIALTLATALTIIYMTSGGMLTNSHLLLLWMCIVMLSIFFSIHHLFVYYVLQPYTTELNVRNPLFFVVNLVVSAACGFSFFFPIPSRLFTIILFILTVSYFIGAFIVVRKYGSQTFRVK